MRKQNKPRKNRKAPLGQKANQPADSSQKDAVQSPARRNFLNRIRTAAIAIPVLGGVGYYSLTAIQASISEADLTKIGNGKPAIVQIHDPQCALCRTLQGQTRDVLGGHDGDTFEYLVANIKTKKGSDLAVRYSVRHVTLLLFDPAGQMVGIIRGPISKSNLRGRIAAHLRRFSS